MPETVAVLGASPKPERYSHRAVRLLQEHGHRVIPVNPGHDRIDGLPVARRLADIHDPVDTVTVYLSPDMLTRLMPELIALKPGRVLFNPGSESDTLAKALTEAGIPNENVCTLVLLRTGQYSAR